MKKSLSIILLVCMLLSMFAGTGFTLRSEDGEELVSGMEALAPVAEEAPQEEAPIEEPPAEEPPIEEPSSEDAPIVSGDEALVPVETETAAPEAEEAEEAEAPEEDGVTQSNVKYIDSDGTEKTADSATVVESSTGFTAWGTPGSTTWYVVTGTGITLSMGATVNGNVNLILADGASLTAQGASYSAGISVTTGNKLTIYGQSTGSSAGALNAIGNSSGAGIGGALSKECGTIIVNGGTVTATGGDYGAGIGGGLLGSGGTVTINGGTVTATGSDGVAGIGAGDGGSSNGTVYVATDLEVKADGNNPPTTVITNTVADADIAASLAGKRYVTVKKALPNYTLVLSGGSVYKNSANAGNELTDTGITGTDNGNDSYTYTFEDVDFETTAKWAIKIEDSVAAITLTGTNTVKGGDSTSGHCYGVYAYSAKLTISGNGILDVTAGNSSATLSSGIYASSLSVIGGTVTATGGTAATDSTGIDLDANISISGGTLTAIGGTATSRSYGIKCGNESTITGGTITAIGGKVNNKSGYSYGVYFNGASSISGSTITAKGDSATTRSCGIYFKGAASISGSTIAATGGTATNNSYGININDATSITGGTVTASGNSQAIYYGKIYAVLTLNGVTVTAGSNADGTGAGSVANATFTGSLGSYKYAQIKEIPVTLVLVGGKVWKSTDNGATNGTEVTTAATDYGITGSGSVQDGYTYAFKNVNFTTTAATAIYVKDTNAAITLEESNTVTGGDSATEDCIGIRANNTGTKLTISGEGSLTVSGGNTGNDSSVGIVAHKLLISGGTIIAKGGNAESDSCGIATHNGLTITDGDVYAEAGAGILFSDGVYATVLDSGVTALELKGGKLTAISVQSATGEKYGLDVCNYTGESSPLLMDITGGTLIAQGGTNAVYIYDGSVNIASALEIYAGASETINAAVANDASLKTNLTSTDNKYVCVKPAPYIASVMIGATTTEYEKFADAWAAATAADVTSTLTLLGNVELTAVLSSSNKFTMTLDLNGKTLGYTSAKAATAIRLTGQPTLIVKDSSSAGTGVLKAESTDGYGTFAINSKGSVTLQSGTVSSKTSEGADALAIQADTVTVEGGTIKVVSQASGKLVNAINTLTVTGGSFNATGKNKTLRGRTSSITGGVYNFDPTAFLDTAHAAKFDDTQATYKWSITDAVAHDGSHGYVSVQAAITAASTTKKTVTMIANSTENVSVATGQDITLDLNGFVLKAAAKGSVITNSGTLTIKDSNTDNQTHYFTDSSGLWVWDTEENTSDAHSVTGGVITGGSTPIGGSAIPGGGILDFGVLTLEGGAVTGNTTSFAGAGVYVGDYSDPDVKAKFTMTGGSICGNASTSYSGGIGTSVGGSIALLGGEIRYNSSVSDGGGVFVWTDDSATIGGGVIIRDNTKGGNVNNLWIDSGIAVKVNSDFNGSVGVTMADTTGVFTAGTVTDAQAALFTSDDPSYIVEKNADGKAMIADPYVTIGTNGYKTVAAALAAAHDSETAEQPTILTIRRHLTENVVIPAGRNIVLDLNGFVLKGTGTGSVIANYGTLTIKDSNTGTQTHKFTVDASTGLWTLNETEGTKPVSGGVITGGNTLQGGGIYNKGTLTLESGSIVGNKASDGGGVFCQYTGSAFTMNGGRISGNTASGGAGININTGSTFTMTDGSVTDNTSSYNAGGIMAAGNKVELLGGTVSGNKASEGSGVYVGPTALTLGGGIVITGNTANDAASNLLFIPGIVATVKSDFNGSVGVSMYIPGVFATGVTATQLALFTADNAAQYVSLENSNAKLANYDCEQLSEKTIKINSFNQPYNRAITETEALAIAKVLLPNAKDETMVAYAASGDKFACVKLDGKAWVSAGTWTLAKLKENGAYIIGSAHEHDWAFTLEGNVITGICPEDNDTQVLTISAQDTTYDGKAKTATVSFTDGDGNPISSFNNETTYTIEYFVKSTEEYLDGAPVDAGTYVAEVHVCKQLENGSQFYTAQVEFTIYPAQLTVADTLALDKTYDGTTDATVKVGIVTGKVSGDDVKVTATGTFDDKNVGEGKEVTVDYALTGDKADNYAAPNSDTLMADVKPAKLTVTGSSMDEKMPYNGTTDALAYAHVGALDGVAAADAGKVSASVKSATLAEKNIGNGKSVTITYELSGDEKENYVTPAGTILSIDVVKRQLTLSETKVGNKLYDATTKAEVTDKGTVLGVVEGEDVTVLVSSSEFADKKAATGKTVTTVFTIEGKDAGNYLAPVDGNNTADITQKPLKVTGVTVKDKTYDGTATAEATITGVEGYVSGDDVKVEVKTALFADKLAAEGKNVNVTYTITGADADNYIIDTESVFTAKATIKKAAVSVSGTTAEDKTYDGTTDVTLKLGTVSGKISGDAVTVELTGKFASKNIGKQDVTVSYKLTGADAANYTVSGNNAKAEIKAKQLTVSGTTAADKEYDETTTATVTVGTLQGVIGSEKVILSATGNFDTADAGMNKDVEVIYAIAGEDIGNYLVPEKETLKATVNKAAPAEAPEYEEVLDVEDFVDEITTTPDSITIKAMEGKEYVLSTSPDDPNENQWAEAKSVKKNGDELTFDHLDANTLYYIHFRTAETKNTMASMCAALVIFSKAETPEITNVTGLTKLVQGSASGDAVITIGEHGDALTEDNVLAVYVDGKELTESQYKAETGCINVTLYKSFLNTLKAGKHTLTVELFGQGYDDMVLETTFTIGKPMSPKTGDTNSIALWLCVLTLCGAATVVVSGKRKEN